MRCVDQIARFFKPWFVALVAGVVGSVSMAASPLGAWPATAPAAEKQTAPLAPALTQEQKNAYAAAMELARKGRLAEARTRAPGQSIAPLDTALAWSAYRAGTAEADFDAISGFITSHPAWPSRALLRRRAEAALDDGVDEDRLVAWFTAHPPATGKGRLYYAAALKAAGRLREAEDLARRGWRTAELDAPEERRFLAEWQAVLTEGDHLARLDHLLWFRATGPARRALARVAPDAQALARARLALITSQWNVDQAVGRVPTHLAGDAGLVYDRVRWRRARGKHDGATALLLATEPDIAAIRRPDRWWRERHLQARKALKDDRFAEAYRLASAHGLAPEKDGSGAALWRSFDHRAAFAEAEWTAGWIALSFTGAAGEAAAHFLAMEGAVNYPVSKARAAYWLAEAQHSLGNVEAARNWLTRAAEYPTTFYGQLAASALGRETILPAPVVPAGPAGPFAGRHAELIGLAQLLAQIGAGEELRTVMRHLAAAATTAAERHFVAELGLAIDRLDQSLLAAKYAALHGAGMMRHAYPEIALPEPVNGRRSLFLAIIRQESAFETTAVSRAGALGLMQLMPPTARRMAGEVGLPYRRDLLTRDSDYNIRLGSARFEGLLDYYEGSYILALAAYNAGEGPVRRWLKDNGDPRQPGVDPIQWIERISYRETRDYVQRVLEGAVVYDLRNGIRSEGGRLAYYLGK